MMNRSNRARMGWAIGGRSGRMLGLEMLSSHHRWKKLWHPQWKMALLPKTEGRICRLVQKIINYFPPGSTYIIHKMHHKTINLILSLVWQPYYYYYFYQIPLKCTGSILWLPITATTGLLLRASAARIQNQPLIIIAIMHWSFRLCISMSTIKSNNATTCGWP